jgi:hypothetical protein
MQQNVSIPVMIDYYIVNRKYANGGSRSYSNAMAAAP